MSLGVESAHVESSPHLEADIGDHGTARASTYVDPSLSGNTVGEGSGYAGGTLGGGDSYRVSSVSEPSRPASARQVRITGKQTAHPPNAPPDYEDDMPLDQFQAGRKLRKEKMRYSSCPAAGPGQRVVGPALGPLGMPWPLLGPAPH